MTKINKHAFSERQGESRVRCARRIIHTHIMLTYTFTGNSKEGIDPKNHKPLSSASETARHKLDSGEDGVRDRNQINQ